jgi:hypothetical protein
MWLTEMVATKGSLNFATAENARSLFAYFAQEAVTVKAECAKSSSAALPNPF